MGAAVTFPGAWALQGINVARNPQMRSTGNAAAATIGLDGDAGATTQMPAGWVANQTAGTLVGTVGGDQSIIGAASANARAALLQTRTRVSYIFTTDPAIGAISGTCDYIFTKNAVAPWQITCTASGTAAAGGSVVDAEVFVEYFWTGMAGR